MSYTKWFLLIPALALGFVILLFLFFVAYPLDIDSRIATTAGPQVISDVKGLMTSVLEDAIDEDTKVLGIVKLKENYPYEEKILNGLNEISNNHKEYSVELLGNLEVFKGEIQSHNKIFGSNRRKDLNNNDSLQNLDEGMEKYSNYGENGSIDSTFNDIDNREEVRETNIPYISMRVRVTSKSKILNSKNQNVFEFEETLKIDARHVNLFNKYYDYDEKSGK